MLNCRGGEKRKGWDQIEGRFGSGGSGGGGGGGGGGGMKKYAIIFTCGGIWEKVVPPPSPLFYTPSPQKGGGHFCLHFQRERLCLQFSN